MDSVFKNYSSIIQTGTCNHSIINGVYQWNDFMTAKLYITNKDLYPVQMKLYEIIVQQQTQTMSVGSLLWRQQPKAYSLRQL